MATTTTPDPTFTAEFQRRTILKASRRLLPLIVIAYLVAYIDRTNIAFASLTMNKDLGFSSQLYGLGAGIFFLGYALFEVPGNMILERVGARRWIARIMLTWGIISGLMATVSGPTSFLVLRFLLGVAEAGFFPGVVLYLTYWFPSAYRARVLSVLYIAVPTSNAVAAVLSGAVLGMDGTWGLRGWQWLFIVEAVPAVVLAFVVLRQMTDRPAKADWLTTNEKAWLESELGAERARIESRGHLGALRSLTDPRVLALALIYFLTCIPSYGITFFLPQIVKELGHTNFVTGLLSALPSVAGLCGLIAFGYSSDRRNERRWHVIVALLITAFGLVCTAQSVGTYWAVLALAVASFGMSGSRPVFWAMPSLFLTGAAAAAGIALINSLGNLGGYLGPFLFGWIKDRTHTFEAGLYALAGFAVLGAFVTLMATRATRGISKTTAAAADAK